MFHLGFGWAHWSPKCRIAECDITGVSYYRAEFQWRWFDLSAKVSDCRERRINECQINDMLLNLFVWYQNCTTWHELAGTIFSGIPVQRDSCTYRVQAGFVAC